ncbi:MAG: hypothetical protein HOV81_40270 [Kofleriaceae bacterium]|nr:hypothetical protein [Kofleriaceae bacterium]
MSEKKDPTERHGPTAWARLGPARGPMICALLVAAVAAIGALVPIGHAGTTLGEHEVTAIGVGAAWLALWAIALAVKAWRLSRTEAAATVLVRPLSSSLAYEIVFSAPLVVAVPMTSLVAGLPSVVGALVCAGLVALREIDVARYVEDGRIHARAGWLWVRVQSAPLDQVREVRVERDSHQGAPSYVVKLELDAALPRLASVEARFRSLDAANAEAERWRRAL